MTPASVKSAPRTDCASPCERLETLVDAGSLQLIRTEVRSRRLGDGAPQTDGVLTGIGTIDGRPIACYAQDARIVGGSFGEAQADAIVRLLEIAGDAHMPVVGFLESSGARIQEGTAGLAGYARVFQRVVSLSHVVPQISIAAGACAGGSAYLPALTDFVIMTEPSAMFLTGPRIVRSACGEDVTVSELGGPRVHRANGVCQLVAEHETDAARLARELLSFLPGGHLERTIAAVPDEEPAEDPGTFLPERPNAVYDVRDVIRALSDGGGFLETDARWARNMVTGFMRLGGHAAAVLANQPRYIGGVIDTKAAEKAARFVELCDAYQLPIVVLVDTPGFMPGTRQERDGIIRFGADLVHAFASATVPRFTVVLRKAYGGAYIAMNSLHLGATLTYAWPQAEIGIMDADSAVRLIHRSSLAAATDRNELLDRLAVQYRHESCSAKAVASDGVVDEIIQPSETRARLLLALDAFTPPSRRAAWHHGRARRARTRLSGREAETA